uniref:Uncharacterized protein n=1 Tax=Calcidiscus leptoporus TaxID=127549 RepID=A0A7S0J2Y0_9EUKA
MASFRHLFEVTRRRTVTALSVHQDAAAGALPLLSSMPAWLSWELSSCAGYLVALALSLASAALLQPASVLLEASSWLRAFPPECTAVVEDDGLKRSIGLEIGAAVLCGVCAALPLLRWVADAPISGYVKQKMQRVSA